MELFLVHVKLKRPLNVRSFSIQETLVHCFICMVLS